MAAEWLRVDDKDWREARAEARASGMTQSATGRRRLTPREFPT
ncbi:MAG: hypothetical protein JWN72_983 [Thermoleophilia bacterium]|nr:hypothetical protein [Thermoleophilia bacterium]